MDIYDEEMRNIYAEVWEILKYTNIADLKKIPEKIFFEIKNNRNINHKFKYNPDKNLEEQEIMEESKNYFSALYYKYCCNPEEKKNLVKHWVDNQ